MIVAGPKLNRLALEAAKAQREDYRHGLVGCYETRTEAMARQAEIIVRIRLVLNSHQQLKVAA